jgi:hypothetical protein
MDPRPRSTRLFALAAFVLVGCPGTDPPSKQDSGTLDTSSPGVDLVGRVWSVDLGAATMVEPMAGGPAELANRGNLVMVTERSAATLGLRIAGAAPDGTQDPCVPTIDMTAVDFSADPVFTSTVDDLGWVVAEGGSGAELCAALEGFGAACVACPDGSGDCVHVAFTEVVGTAVDVADLVPVEAPCETR